MGESARCGAGLDHAAAGGRVIVMLAVPRPNPRHPFPAWHAEFSLRGWWVFRTTENPMRPMAHAVLCASLPAACATRLGVSEHVAAVPEEFRGRLVGVANALEAHAEMCGRCARVVGVAVGRALL